nr:O-antigen ligase family protein [Bradyrhizobium jicamae]
MLAVALLCCKPALRGTGDWLLAGSLVAIGAGYALVLWQQLSPDFWPGIQPDVVWKQMADLLKDGTANGPRISVARNQPLFALGNVLACLAAVTCAFFVARNKRNAELLLKVVAWSGTAYAVYGICAFVLYPEFVLFREKVLYRNVLTATFMNRNTAALYFGTCAVLWALVLAREARRRDVVRNGAWQFGKLRWDWKLGARCAGFLICVLAMMLTGSRAGVAISFAGIIAAVLVLLRRELNSRRARRWTLGSIVVGAGLLLLLLGGQVTERLSEHGLTGGGRWEAYQSTVRMIADHPVVGTGIGTFVFIFPRYRSGDVAIWGIWDKAHNTLLELAAEAGLPLAIVITLAWVIALALMLQGMLRRRRGTIYPTAGLICGAMALFHSMIDFSFQIPGFAITAMVLVGVGLGQREPDARRGEAASSPPASRLTA